MNWIETKSLLPPLGEVVEGIVPKEWLYSKLDRDYFALVKIRSKLIWITPHLCDYNYDELEVTHWRHILPNPKNKKPFIKIKRDKISWEPAVVFKKIRNIENASNG